MTKTRTKLLSLLLVVCIASMGLSFLFVPKAQMIGASWLSGYLYRKSHVIANATGAGTDYQVCIKVYKTTGADGTEALDGETIGKVYLGTGSNVRDDFGDVNFTDDDGASPLDYYMERLSSGTSAVFWVEIKDSLEAAAQTIYIYYGKSDATTKSNMTDTFLYSNDWEDMAVSWVLNTSQAGDSATAASKYLYLDKGANVGSNRYTRAFSTSRMKMHIALKSPDGATGRCPLFIAYNQAWASSVYVGIGDSGANVFEYYNGSYQTIFNGVTAQWYHVVLKKVDSTNDKYNIYVYDAAWALKGSVLQVAFVTVATTLEHVAAQTYYANHDGQYDDFYVCKYIATEPVQGAWGALEVYGAVATSTTIDALAYSCQKATFYDAVNGYHYLFYSSVAGTIGYESSSDGTTWNGSYTTLAGPFTANGLQDFSLWWNGSYVSLAYTNWAILYYCEGPTNSSGLITWAAVRTASSIATIWYYYPFVFRDSSGYPIIGVLRYNDTAFTYHVYAVQATTITGTAWSAPVELSVLSSSNWRVTGVPLSSRDAYIIYGRDGQPILGAFWNSSASSWTKNQVVSTSSIYVGDRMSAVSYGSDIYLVFENVTTYQTILVNRTSNAWNAEVVLSIGGESYPTIVKNAPAFYVFAVNGTSECVYGMNYTVVGGWGASWLVANASAYGNVLAFTTSYEATSLKVSLAWEVGDSSPYALVYYGFDVPIANSAPTIGVSSGTCWDDIDNCYAQKKSYTVSVSYSDAEGFADIHYCELYLKTGGNVTRATFQFHEDDNSWSTPTGSTEWTLIGYSNASAGNNLAIVWGFQAQWDAVEENALDFLFFVTDTVGESVNSLSGTPFDVVTRLVTESFANDDNRINIAGTTTISGTVYYANNPGSDTASASYPPDVEFTSVSIHNSTHTSYGTDNTVVNGAFSVSFSIPGAVQSNPYHAYIALADADGTDQDALDADTTAVIGDAVMLFLSIDDNRINMGDTIYANLNATYAYDGTDIITGTIKLNGTNMVYQSGNWWRLGMSQATVGQWTYCVDSVTGNAYGITQMGIINLNKVGDRFIIPDSAGFAMDALTVAVWVKPTASVDTGYLIDQYDVGTGDGFFLYQLDDRGDGTAAWVFECICGGGGDAAFSDGPPLAGVWQHIVGMRDSSGNLKLYIDGVLQANTTVVGGGVIDSTSSVYIGTLFGMGAADFDGYLCEHRFYNRSLLLPEIYQLYQGRQTNNTGLVALYSRPSYDMDAALWRDLSGNGHDGVIVGVTITAGLSTDETVRPIWDNLTITNLQPVQYLGAGEYKYEAQLEYGYDLVTISGGYAVLAYPNGTVVGKVSSNTTGWVTFIVGQLNSTSGAFNIYGENETLWTITYPGLNQTFANYCWTLAPQDVSGNSLTNTSLNMTLGTTIVWNGTATTVYVPPDTFNLTATWLQALIVNSTLNVNIAGDTTTSLNCTCYPYVIGATRYWAASNATITSVAYAGSLLTVQFSCPVSTYVLVASYTTRPSYVLNVTYDYTTAFAPGYLVMPHFGNTTIIASYENWAGLYVKKTDRLMLSVGWAGQRLDIVTNGTTGDSGELDVYCSSRGAPASDSGFTVTSYVGGVFIGLYTFASPHTGSLEWASGAASSGGTTGQPQASVFITLAFSFPKNVQSGTTLDGFLNVSWMGAATVYIWSVVVDSDYASDWKIQVARLPWTLETLMQNGHAQVPVVLYITGSLAAGNYSVPCDVTFHTVEGVSKTVRSILTFEVTTPIAEVPSMLVYVFLGGIVLVVTGGVFWGRQKRRKYSQ